MQETTRMYQLLSESTDFCKKSMTQTFGLLIFLDTVYIEDLARMLDG